MTQRGNQQHHPSSIKSPSTRPRSALSVRLVPSLHLRLPCCLRVIYGCPAPSVSFIVIEPGPYCRPVPISTSLPVCPQCAPLLRLRLPSSDLCCSPRFCFRFTFGCPVLQPSPLLPSTAGPTVSHGPARIPRFHQPRARSLIRSTPASHLAVTIFIKCLITDHQLSPSGQTRSPTPQPAETRSNPR